MQWEWAGIIRLYPYGLYKYHSDGDMGPFQEEWNIQSDTDNTQWSVECIRWEPATYWARERAIKEGMESTSRLWVRVSVRRSVNEWNEDLLSERSIDVYCAKWDIKANIPKSNYTRSPLAAGFQWSKSERCYILFPINGRGEHTYATLPPPAVLDSFFR